MKKGNRSAMRTTRIRYLISAGILAATAVLGAPTALAQPAPCPTGPNNTHASCAVANSMYGPITDPDKLPPAHHNHGPGMPGSPTPP